MCMEMETSRSLSISEVEQWQQSQNACTILYNAMQHSMLTTHVYTCAQSRSMYKWIEISVTKVNEKRAFVLAGVCVRVWASLQVTE